MIAKGNKMLMKVAKKLEDLDYDECEDFASRNESLETAF